MELILLSRVFVADLDAFTTQWREYLFNTNDPDGPILQNLVINSTAFELTDGALVWINPATNDEYYYDSPNAVTKVAGTPPAPIPDPPDLTDPYGLRYVHEFLDLNGTTCKFEIYQKDYIGASEEVGGGATSVSLSYENEGKIFTSFRGSSASVVLSSRTSRKFYELFESDEREYYGRLVIDSLPVWTGWNIPDIFTEPWGNPPYITNLNFSDGIGGLKNLPFPDVNDNGFTGTVSEKDAIIACLNRIGLRLNVNIACNIREEGMDTLSQPIEQSLVNVEAFVTFNQGERTAINCYDALQKMLKSWNAVIFQEGNEWWIVREPELYSSALVFKKFDADGVAISTGAKTLTKTFAGEGILLTGAMLETKPAFTNVAVSQEYGELLVENGNFAVNGNFENWTPYILGGFQQGWQLNNWSYNSLSVFPFTTTGSLGRVRRVSESSGIDEVNNYINIYEVVRSFSDPVGSLSSVPFPVKKEIGNRLQVTFKVRCNTKGSDNRLVEAYFNIGVRVGSKWLAVDTDGEYYWESVNTRLRWRVAQVMRWENITLPPMEIPEDGDVEVFIYQIVQVGSVSKVEYVCDFDDVEIKLVDNPALQNERVYYKTANPDVYTATLEELEIELGDVATIMSQNAKIINGEPSGSWTRPGDSTGVPLAKLLCRELANQYQRTIYRLKSGTTNKLAAPLSLLANYEDTVNEPGRLFILTGGEWDIKRCTWRPDFVEINQTETTVEIRVVEEPRSGTDSNTGSNSGGGAEDTGSSSPEPPSVPVDLGDLDDVIPIIREGRFEDSQITALRDANGDIIQHQFPSQVKGLPAIDEDEFVTKSQLPVIPQYGLLSGGTIQWTGTGLTYVSSLAVVAIGEILTAQAATITLDAADPTNDRFDVLGWRYVSEGVAELFYLKGTAASSPTIPQVNPESEVEGLVILVPATATTPSGLTTENVYLENTEWTVSKTGTGTLDADSTDNPKTGTKAIKSTDTALNYRLRLTRSTPLDISTLTDATLGLDVSLIAAMANNQSIAVIFLDASGNAASNQLFLQLNKSLITYQFAGFALAQFIFLTTEIQSIEFRWLMKGGGTFAGFYLDNIKIQGGVSQPIASGIEEAPNDGQEYVRKNRAWAVASGGGTTLDSDIVDGLESSLSDSPGTSNRYVTVNLLNSYAYVQEAPINGNHYARKDGAWVAFTPFAVTGTPSEGQVVTYVSGVPTWATPSGGGGISGLTTNKITKATSATTIGDSGITEESAISYLFGNRTSLSTPTPLKVSLGGTIGNNTAGSSNNIKLKIYDDGNPINDYGIGLGSGLLEIRAGFSGGIALFVNNGVERFRISPTGQITASEKITITGASSGAQTPLEVTAGGTETRIKINHNTNAGFGLFINNVKKWSIASYNTNSDFTIYNDARVRIGMYYHGLTNNVVFCDQNTTPTDTGFRFQVIGNSLFGSSTTLATGTPMVVSFGGSYGTNTPGSANNLKWKLYSTAGFTPNVNDYGIGMSAGLMEFRAGSGASMAFFPNNGVELMRLISGGFVVIGVNTNPANTRFTVRGLGTGTGVTQLLEASDGTDNVVFLDNGQIRFLRLPTSATGLAAGTLYNDTGTLKVA